MNLNDEQCTIVKGRIAAAIAHQETMWTNPESTTAEVWPDSPSRWLALVRGEYWRHRRAADAPRRHSNQILPKLRAKHQALTSGKTTFFVEAQIEQMQPLEGDTAALLNTMWQAERYDIQANRARWDSDVYGVGVVEVGWVWERGGEQMQGERGEPQLAPDAMPMIEDGEGNLLMPMGPEMAYETQAQAEAAARSAQIDEDKAVWGNPTLDDPFIERFCPRYLLVDPNCTSADLSDARYAFRVRWQYTQRLKADRSLRNTKDLKGTVYSIRDDDQSGSLFATDQASVKDDRAMTKLFDGYLFLDIDRDGREEFIHVIMTDEHDKALYVGEAWCTGEDGKPLFPINPFPFRLIPGIIADNDVWLPDSAVEQAAPLQLDYDESSSSLNDQRRKSPRQYLAPKGALDNDAIRKLERGIDGAIIEVEPGLKDQLVPFPHQPIRGELFQSLEALPVEIGRQLGVSPYEEATLPQKDMTKAEVMTLANLGGGRTSGDANTFRLFKEDLANCLLILLQHFGDRARSYSMQLPDGQRKWGTMRNTDLRGSDGQGNMLPPGIQWRVQVDASQEQPKNKQLDQENKLKLLEIVSRYAQMPDEIGRPMVNIRPVLRMVWEAFDEGDANSIIPPDPTPEELAQFQQQQAIQQALQALAAQQEQAAMQGQAEEAAGRERQAQEMGNVKTIADIIKGIPPEVLAQIGAQMGGNGGQMPPM